MAKFTFNLADINENNGLIIRGIKIDSVFSNIAPVTGNNFSFTIVSPKGDFNGDGIDDLLLESTVFVNENETEQESYLILGSNDFPADLNVAELNGNNGLVIQNTNSVISTTSFSDLNGDGKDDLSIIAGDLSGETRNIVNYNIFGDDNLPSVFNIADLNGDNGFSVIDNNLSLVSFSFEKNINKDEFQDLAFIGTSELGEIQTKIVFGNSSYPANLDISVLDGNNGFVVEGENILTGGSIDFNDDGVGELAFVDNSSPKIIVLFGSNTFPAIVDLDSVDGNNGFLLTETGSNTSDRLFGGLSEDVNGDGLGEIIIQKFVSDETKDDELEPNKVYVLFGQDGFTSNFDLATVDGNNGFQINAPLEVEGIIDFNGDNLQDIIFDDTATEGRKYVIFGSSNGYEPTLDLNSLDGSNGFIIENLPSSFKDRGDVNGDGLEDAIFETQDDTTYVLFSSNNQFAATLDVEDSQANVLEIGSTDTQVSRVLDLNNDSRDDLVFNPVLDSNSEDSTAISSIVLGREDFSDTSENTIELYRFKNNTFATGTYVFVGAAEKDAIIANPDLNQTFELEGNGNPAFIASTFSGEKHIPFFRLSSKDIPGTFLFVSTEEYDAIFAPDSNQRDKWEKQGFDQDGNDIAEFYLLPPESGSGIPFNRYQNLDNGTFLYAGPTESEAIDNNPDFSHVFLKQGGAFESLI